jgi:cadmium resistance protein CadD (predicted permease)
MESVSAIFGVAAISFAATNLDGLLVLVAVLARPGQRFPAVVGGAVLAASALLLLCALAGLAVQLASTAWIDYLGLLPIGYGLLLLDRLGRMDDPADEVFVGGGPSMTAPAIGMLLLAGGADSVSVLVPLFAETKTVLKPVIAIEVLAISVVGCWLARGIVAHERVGRAIARMGPRLVPFVLIAVGIYILMDTGNDLTP